MVCPDDANGSNGASKSLLSFQKYSAVKEIL
jgi:hypothetical protein